MRIPFSQLRFTDRDEQVWGLNVNRYIPTRNEDLFWVMVPKNETGWSSRFGNLVGIRGIRPSRRLELVPYVASNATMTGARDRLNPFDNGRNLGGRMGADLKMGLGPSLTLDGTVNPDFGQVEADPAEVNLSAFPTLFTERRPFFAEGSDLLSMAGFFYSRRVGAPPHGDVSGSFVDRPPSSIILGAAKLAGRLGPSLSVAALSAVTNREVAPTYDTTTGSFGRVRVEPLTGYGVARLVGKFGSAGSTAGLLLTGVRRDLAAGDPLAAVLDREAVTGGGNGVFRFQGGQYEARWMVGFSRIRGDSAALRVIQQSSAHYFQRPDITEVRYDPTRTSLTGYTFSWRLEKLGGRHWLWDTWGEYESPTFELNDLGRLMSGDDRDFYVDVKYRENRPTRLFYSYNVGLSAKSGWNFGGDRQFSYASVNPAATWRNYLNTWLHAGINAHAMKDDLTRGGPLMRTSLVHDYSGGFSTNERLAASGYGEGDYAYDDLGGWSYALIGGVTARPGGRWSLSVEPRYRRTVEPRQYLAIQTRECAGRFHAGQLA